MKPTLMKSGSDKSFPTIDCNYHSIALDGFNGHCAKLAPSFRNISREYFETEAPRDFLADGALFVTMIAAVTVPIVSGALAIIELCRSVGVF